VTPVSKKSPTRGFHDWNFTESDVTGRHAVTVRPQATENKTTRFGRRDVTVSWKPSSLEHVGAILRRMVAENPEQWAWLLNGRAEQKEVA
jgi:hypothetical protein